jgi:TctA family transporter
MTATILTQTYNFSAYMIYLPIVITLTVLVSQFLFKNSKTFMIDIFRQKQDIAMATNSLFKIGFYLLNLGFALCIIEFFQIETVERLVVALSKKIGGFSIYLGVMMLLNLLLFLKGRKHAMNKDKVQAEETSQL